MQIDDTGRYQAQSRVKPFGSSIDNASHFIKAGQCVIHRDKFLIIKVLDTAASGGHEVKI
jgi:hypothetical protein